MIREVIRERHARRKLSSAFSAYLSPQLLSVISQRLDSTMMSGATKDVTILFSDLRGFTAMTGKTDSRALVAQLNEYFTEMVDCINRNDGSVHKFIGDAIMAAWGDITSAGAQQETIKSLRAGLAMGQALKKLNTLWESQGRAKLGMGIGINFGNVVVGDIGAPQRHEFTVIGDAVNVASRLEGANKLFGTEILVGESVHSLASEFFVFRELGLVKLAGKDKGAPLYELVAEIGRENESRYPADWLKVYHEAYRSLRSRRYDVAIRLFEACLREIPGDVACGTYLDTARGLADNPPPADWVPVLEALSK
jgi:adenylate cyclase